MKKSSFVLPIAIVAMVFVGIGIGLYALISIREFPYTFYYITEQSTELVSERRALNTNFSEWDRQTVRLVEEYMLGPLDYRLRLNLSDSFIPLSVYCMTNEGEESIVINFTTGFITYIRKRNDDAYHFLRGLLKTLKENTRIKTLYIRVDNKIENISAGKWDIGYPIMVTDIEANQ